MKILSIKAQAFARALPRHFQGSNYSYTHKNGVFAYATTDEGVDGVCYLGDDFGLAQSIAKAVNDDFSKILIGREISDVESVWQDMRPLVRNILADRRVTLHAQAVVDILCWDILAKVQKQSLVDLLGPKRNDAPIMAIAGYYTKQNALTDLANETRELITLGCKGMKLKVGGLSVEEDIARVRTVREAGGDAFNLAADANQAWSLKQALQFVDACSNLGLSWVEEPVHWDNDIVDLAFLRKQTDIPICAGQSEINVAGIARLIDAGAVDICNLHPGYAGGVTPWLAAAELARKNGLKVANTGEPQLSASLMLACEHGMSVEIYHPERDPCFPEYCPVFHARKNGCIGRSNLMGWGIVPRREDGSTFETKTPEVLLSGN